MGEQIKKMKAKVIHKYETEANWNLSNYIPDVGETVFYDIDEAHDYVRQKNGDGIHSVKDLPFVSVQNIQDSTAKGSIHQAADGVENGFDFTNKNPNATELDETLTGTIPYGATGNFASAFGGKSAAMGKRSHAEGTTTIAKGAYSHAEGDNSVTLGADSHAEGYKTTAAGEGSHAEGARTIAAGEYSHAEGIDTQTTDFAAHAEGELTHAYGRASHAEGQKTFANGDASHAEGTDTEANGFASHAEGAASYAVGESSHAEGNRTYAEGNFSHTEGNNTYAGVNPSGEFFGESAHAEGENTHAYGYASHTEGIGTEAYGEAQHVQGRYNIDDPEGRYAHIVGNGFSNYEGEASNAHTLDWQGNAWYAGDVYVGGANQDEGKKLATEESVTTILNNELDNYQTKLSGYKEGSNASFDGAGPDIIKLRTDYASYGFNKEGINFSPEGSTDEFSISAYNAYGKGKLHTDLSNGDLKYTAEYYAGWGDYDNVIYSGTKTVAFKEDLGAIGSEFDLVVETEEDFRKCFYMLHPNKLEDGSIDLSVKGEPNPDFKYRSILVKNIDFTSNLGSSDLDLAVTQPSVRYIKFDNCQWHCRWYISGERPDTLNSTTNPTEYKKANTQFNVILDGITIDEQNVLDSLPTNDDLDRYYYVGLRNFERIENCYIHYPKDYALIEEAEGDTISYRYSFKFNLQYFTTVQNCKVTALWDGENISGCRVTERIVRCYNCTNILAEPILKAGEPYRVQMRQSSNLSNIYGSPIIYTDCKAIDTDTCSDYDAPKASEVDEFDLIITSMDDLATLPSNTTAKSVLVTGFSLNSTTKVPGFFTNTINATNEPYFVKFIIPKNIQYIKFSKSFYYTTARVVIQGHPDCILDGLPTITAPYNYTHCATLYDFKEVRNCYARGINTYTENNELVENATTVGISNVLMSMPNATSYPALASSYNYKKTRFTNCDLSYIDYAESVTNSRIIANAKMGYSPCIKNAATINGLKIYSISATQTVTLESCSHISNVDSNGYNIVYNACTKVDVETCDNVPDSLITYVTKDIIDESIKDLVSNSKLKSSIEYDLIISSIDEFKALESNTIAVNVLVQNFGIYRADHVNGFFDNSASDYMYWTKFKIPMNVKYIKFNNFKQNNSRVVIQGHEDCIIDGFPTVSSPYTPAKLYGNDVVLYNFKEVRNSHCTNVHQIDAEGNYTFVPGVNGISNVILDMPYPAKEYSITISGEKIIIDTSNLAPDREEQNTKFVNCDLMFIKSASAIENCRVHMGRLMTDYMYKTPVPAISDVDLISGLTVQHIASNGKLTIKNCKNILGVNENGYTVDYIDCSNVGASKEYVDDAITKMPKIEIKSEAEYNQLIATGTYDANTTYIVY